MGRLSKEEERRITGRMVEEEILGSRESGIYSTSSGEEEQDDEEQDGQLKRGMRKMTVTVKCELSLPHVLPTAPTLPPRRLVAPSCHVLRFQSFGSLAALHICLVLRVLRICFIVRSSRSTS